jgi:AraC family transcriptional regulator of adaptative response/methylated-DNA-[protein]-cysteine methyltransferase
MLPEISASFADDDARWAAVAARDKAADGRFWCCVVTTKIYCRPSCPARPHRKNVRFASSLTEARNAGYRACKRCRPDEVRMA